jgi:plasmid stabilization system protein ParE
MVTINWTDEAVGWLQEIYAYIANDNPKAARNTVNKILEKSQVIDRVP